MAKRKSKAQPKKLKSPGGPRSRGTAAGPAPNPDLAIVAIGASAGGLEPLCKFFDAMPAKSGAAFVVIQHLDPASKSMLAELLARHTAMTVRQAEQDMTVKPNEVYVVPPASNLGIAAGALRLTPAIHAGVRAPIDIFLHALAADRERRGIGILMSGSGTDGAEGLKAVKKAGGLTLVQDPSEAQHGDMPRYAMTLAQPDDVLPVRDMPDVVTRYLGHAYVKKPQPAAIGEEKPAGERLPFKEFVEVLKQATGQDFERYKSGTLERRIERRMAAQGSKSWSDYLALLRKSPSEADALAKDILINVTRFFRDPEAFASLARAVPGLLAGRGEDAPVRVWVPGCSSGEEAYSLGIILREQTAAAGRPIGLQIFATDIDDEALQAGRTGIYLPSIAAEISPERLEHFFVREGDFYRVAKDLRAAVIFNKHDLLRDPPLSRMDLVSCRNLLIYLKPDAQRRVLAGFNFSLAERGVLFLGPAESVAIASDLFEPVDEKHRIYRRHGHIRPARAGFTLAEARIRPGAPSQASRVAPASLPLPSVDLVQRMMLEVYAPPAVVTNRLFVPLYYLGATDRYLRIVPGEPNRDILSMAREGLRAKLREIVARAFRSKRRVAAHGVAFKQQGRPSAVTIEAQRLMHENEDLVLVSFIEEPTGPVAKGRARGKRANVSEMKLLQDELIDSRRELNRTIYELRRANDEFKAKNEEAMSLNEEFISANEELESTKEEFQSLNEELTTVNAELRQTLEVQRRTSNDLANVLNSSAVATIVLDRALNIKVFNPRMSALFALIDADIGRPLADLLPKFADPQLLAAAKTASTHGTASEQEIHAQSGVWFTRTVSPYRTETGEIDGAIVTFADVTRLKQLEIDAIAAHVYSETIIDTVREPLVALDADFKIVSTNTSFRAAFLGASQTVAGRRLIELQHSILGASSLEPLLRHVLESEQPVEPIEIEQDNAGGYHVWRANARKFRLPTAERPMLLLALEDITGERRVLRQQLQMVLDALPEAFLTVDNQRRIRSVSKHLQTLFGYRAEELIGQPVEMLVPAQQRAEHVKLHDDFLANPTTRPMGTDLDIEGLTKDGRRIPLDVGLSPVPTADGAQIIAAIHDLQERKRIEAQLREAKADADRANQAKSRFLAAASHDLRQPLQTISLLLGMLGRQVAEPETWAAVGKMNDTVADMTELLDTLLDINRIESGAIRPQRADFSIAATLTRAANEFSPVAAAKALELHVVPSSLMIRSDPQLLMRIVGNLLSNAIKYTEHGKILVGCRRRGDKVRVEVWDTGIGIPQDKIDAIFDEFYRLDTADSGKLGLGLGLYIVQRYASLLGHSIEVRSTPGKGTMFALVAARCKAPAAIARRTAQASDRKADRPGILLIEDNPDQLEALRALLEHEGYRVAAARTADTALVQIGEPTNFHPDLVIADYNLPGGTTGLQIIQQLEALVGPVPSLIVTGGKSVAVLEALQARGLAVITKPVNAADLLSAVRDRVKPAQPDFRPKKAEAAPPEASSRDADIAIIDDEPGVRDAFRAALEANGRSVQPYASAEAFLADPGHNRFRCLVVDLGLPGIDGLALQARLKAEKLGVPLIFFTGSHELPKAVQAMREGAADFLQKPVVSAELLDSVERALERGAHEGRELAERAARDARVATLTARERQVMDQMVAGELTKNIAMKLGISERTTEHHRQSVMRKMGVKSLALLVRMMLDRLP